MSDYEEHPDEMPEEFEEGDGELPAGEPDTFFGKVVSRTPWWGISVGAHALAVMVLSFIVVFGLPLPDADAVVLMPKNKPRVIPEMEPPKELLVNKKFLHMKKSVEDPIWRKYAKEDVVNQSDDDQEFEKMMGDSLDFVSDKPFKGKGTYDTIGLSGGSGGRYGGRLGDKRDLVASGGGGGDTEDAVLLALRWLARHQSEDGSWGVLGYTARCNRTLPNGKSYGNGPCTPNPGCADHGTGVTGLSMLAFLGAGYSHLSKDTWDGICFGDVVRKGLKWIMSQQDTEGCIGSRNTETRKYMYDHVICTLALSEAYGLTGSNLFKDQAQKAVDFTVAAQNPGKGWRYIYKSGDNDSSVTGWAVMALKSAELSGLSFPRTAYDGARNWLDEVTGNDYYRVGYIYKGTGKVHDEHNKNYDHHEALAAISAMCRTFMDRRKNDPRIRGACELLMRDLPRWSGNAIDFYYWYYGTLALFQYDAPRGNLWKQWNTAMKEALVKTQNGRGNGCKTGSWEPVGRWCCEGGRVYSTAINALTLEVYYLYGNVFVGDKK